MSENENTEFDPFATDDVQDAPPAEGDDLLDNMDLNSLDEDDDLFADADFSMEEEDSGEAVKVRDSGAVYDSPLDVGLKDGMWVAVRLTGVSFVEKHTPRLSSKVCVAVKVDANGKKRVYIPYDQVEAQIKAGATEVVRELPLPYFIAEANHVAPEFGQRRYPYEIEVPALTIKTAFFRDRRDGKTGFPNKDGYSLRKATGATEKGEKVSLETMPDIASRMEDQIVMAKVSLSTKERTRPRLDPMTNQAVSILVTPEDGQPVTVIEIPTQATEGDEGPGSQYLLNDGTGQEWEGDPRLLTLIGVKDGTKEYAIIDSSENSTQLMESYPKTTDYINAPFLPVPDRAVRVEMAEPKTTIVEVPGQVDGEGHPMTKIDEEPVFMEGEITLATVGAIAQGKTPGTPVDVLLKNGNTITAIWLGTQWVEKAPKKDEASKGGGLDEFAGVAGL